MEEKLPPVEHGVESCNLVNPHWRHFKHFRDIVHDADARPSFVLSLAQIKEWNNGCFLILRRVPGDDILRALQVFWREFEGDLGRV